MQAGCELTAFVETGSYLGDGIATAIEAGYSPIHSCDANVTFVEHCRKRFVAVEGPGSVNIHLADSLTFLAYVLPGLTHTPSLFWLDAHFPHVYGYSLASESGAFPLLSELQAIHSYRGAVDIVLCDDIRVIADTSNPCWRSESVPQDLVIDKIKVSDLMSAMPLHDALVSADQDGILAFVPQRLSHQFLTTAPSFFFLGRARR